MAHRERQGEAETACQGMLGAVGQQRGEELRRDTTNGRQLKQPTPGRHKAHPERCRALPLPKLMPSLGRHTKQPPGRRSLCWHGGSSPPLAGSS